MKWRSEYSTGKTGGCIAGKENKREKQQSRERNEGLNVEMEERGKREHEGGGYNL